MGFSILVILKPLKGLRRIAETSLCHLCMLIMLFLLFPWNQYYSESIYQRNWNSGSGWTNCQFVVHEPILKLLTENYEMQSYCFSIVSPSCRVITGVTMVVCCHLWSPGLRFLSQLCEGSRGKHKQGLRRHSHVRKVNGKIVVLALLGRTFCATLLQNPTPFSNLALVFFIIQSGTVIQQELSIPTSNVDHIPSIHFMIHYSLYFT